MSEWRGIRLPPWALPLLLTLELPPPLVLLSAYTDDILTILSAFLWLHSPPPRRTGLAGSSSSYQQQVAAEDSSFRHHLGAGNSSFQGEQEEDHHHQEGADVVERHDGAAGYGAKPDDQDEHGGNVVERYDGAAGYEEEERFGREGGGCHRAGCW